MANPSDADHEDEPRSQRAAYDTKSALIEDHRYPAPEDTPDETYTLSIFVYNTYEGFATGEQPDENHVDIPDVDAVVTAETFDTTRAAVEICTDLTIITPCRPDTALRVDVYSLDRSLGDTRTILSVETTTA